MNTPAKPTLAEKLLRETPKALVEYTDTCPFENTAHGLAKCNFAVQDIIDGKDTADMSPYERRGLADLIGYAKEFVQLADRLDPSVLDPALGSAADEPAPAV